MMTFETEEDLRREKKAIEVFVKTFGGSYQKLDPLDIDFKIFDREKKLIAYAEVKGRVRSIKDAYPLPVSARKLVKLVDKRIAAVLIWSCDDGIIYGVANKLKGEIRWGGRQGRPGAISDEELMVYYEKQRGLKYVRFS
jgi:hypothetical protein